MYSQADTMFSRLFVIYFLLSGCSLTIQTKPKLSDVMPTRSQSVGTRFTLLCTLQEGTRPFVFEWRKDGTVITANARHRIENDQEQSIFTISRLEAYDTSTISCTARNKHGFDTQTTRLTVKGLGHSSPSGDYFTFHNDMWRI